MRWLSTGSDGDEFARVLRIGLGRAVLFLRERDTRPYRETILHACLRNMAYDPQLEGSRARYLFDVIEATGDAASFLQPVTAALVDARGYWDTEQLFDLAVCFAQAGYDAARDAVYAKFDRSDAEEPFLGAGALVDLDGLDGLLHVADRLGQALLTDPQMNIEPHGLWLAQEQFGAETVHRSLADFAGKNPHIAAYLQAVVAERERQAQHPASPRATLETADYATVKAAIAEYGSRGVGVVVLQRWGRQASDTDLARAAADLLAETDEDRRVAYLRIFRKRRFPLDPGPLLPLVRHPNDRLAAEAFNALSLITDARVRALALDLLEDDGLAGARRGRGAELLEQNPAPGDVVLMTRLLSQRRDPEELHSLGFGILDLLAAHPAADAAPALLALYEFGPCSVCRGRCVERLHDHRALPDWLVEECQHDADLDLRATAAAWAVAS